MKVEEGNKKYSRELNEQYNDIKRRLDQTNDEIKRIQQEMEDKKADRTILLGKIAEAKRTGDKVAEKDAQTKLTAVEKRLQQLEVMDKKQKEKLAVIKVELDKKAEERNGNTPIDDFEEANDQYLEEVNDQYLDIKRRFNQANVELSKLEKLVEDKMSDRTILLGKRAEAKRTGDKVAEKDAQTKLTVVERDLKKLNAKAKEQKDRIAVIQMELDKKIDEKIRNIPGMKEHLNEIIRKHSVRKMPSVDEELKPVLEEKAKLEQILLLTATHPKIENNLKAFMSAAKQLEPLKIELAALKDGVDDKGRVKFKDEKRAAHILNKQMPSLRKKISDAKATLLAYFEKNKISLDEKDLEALVNGKVVMNQKGEVDFKTTMAAKMGSLDRKIKGIQKNKAKLERTIYNVQGIETPAPQPQPTPTPEPQPVPAKEDDYDYDYEYDEPEQKPKFWQFIKRFKMWMARRQQQKLAEQYDADESILDEETMPEKPEIGEAEPVVAREHREFRNSLKYEILRDAVDREMKEQLRKAREQGRNSGEGR